MAWLIDMVSQTTFEGGAQEAFVILVWVAVESDDELDGTVTGAATTASTCDFGLPIRLFFVEAAEGFPPFGNRRPRFVGAGGVRHQTAMRNWDLAMVGGFAFGHPKTTCLFGSGGEIRGHLALSTRRP